jgi:hypothetical protein
MEVMRDLYLGTLIVRPPIHSTHGKAYSEFGKRKDPWPARIGAYAHSLEPGVRVYRG